MKDLKKIVRFAWQYIKVYKRWVITYIVLGTFYSLFEMASPFVMGWLIDSMMFQKSVKMIVTCALVFLGVNVMCFVLAYFVKTLAEKVLDLTAAECSRQMAEHAQRCSLKYTSKLGSAPMIQRVYYSGGELIAFVENFFFLTIGKAITGIIALAVIFSIDIVCGLAVLVELPIIIFLYLKFQNKLLKRNRARAEKNEKFFESLYTLMLNIRHIKLNNIFDVLAVKNKRVTEEKVEADVKAVKIEFVYAMILENLAVFLQVFLFFYGGIAVINGNMTVGDFTIIYSYFAVVNGVTAYFLELGKDIQAQNAYYERLREITDNPIETNGTEMVEKINRIDLKNIDFKYENNLILQNFSYSFEKGKLYVVAGENGSGKSTMISLLLGLYIDEFAGDITYNGLPIQQIDMQRVRREKIGVCEQEPYLIDDTIRYNMSYSNDAKNDQVLMELSQHVGLNDFLNNTEKQLDTQAGENGDALSGGQKQKTALVKAFFKNPELLVLDEPTSAMDAEGSEKLINYLKSIKKDKIIIAITHDPKMLKAADEVVAVKKVSLV